MTTVPHAVLLTLFGLITPSPWTLIPAVSALVILLFLRRIRRGSVELRRRKDPSGDRFGFGAPLKETPRSNEHQESAQTEG